ncbi:response regulator transcription factor [Anatilimnocola floriformis]|uniref:response regulator transcription factor n=1 Tax=Anatilimnocola floriformis TaxID=2948575 RepID=UPI0020C3CBC5|nr:response regulator [Anatilimnocola floriformis]
MNSLADDSVLLRDDLGFRRNQPIHVHVIDDDADVRASLEWTLRSVGYPVQTHASVAEFSDCKSVQTPCCVIVDLIMPGMTGLKFCRELASRSGCNFVMLTGHGDIATAVEAMKLGATDFLEKPCPRQKLLSAVQRAQQSLLAELVELKEEELTRQQIEQLTTREKEVLEQMAQGRVTKEIASQLGISAKTVDVHRSRISQKLRFDSPTQLGRFVAVEYRRQQRLIRQQPQD